MVVCVVWREFWSQWETFQLSRGAAGRIRGLIAPSSG